jgi:hypothetical protein
MLSKLDVLRARDRGRASSGSCPCVVEAANRVTIVNRVPGTHHLGCGVGCAGEGGACSGGGGLNRLRKSGSALQYSTSVASRALSLRRVVFSLVSAWFSCRTRITSSCKPSAHPHPPPPMRAVNA